MTNPSPAIIMSCPHCGAADGTIHKPMCPGVLVAERDRALEKVGELNFLLNLEKSSSRASADYLRGVIRDLEERLAAAVEDPNRCACCGWPLVQRMEDGCVRGNCSMRPMPVRMYSPTRFEAEKGMEP